MPNPRPGPPSIVTSTSSSLEFLFPCFLAPPAGLALSLAGVVSISMGEVADRVIDSCIAVTFPFARRLGEAGLGFSVFTATITGVTSGLSSCWAVPSTSAALVFFPPRLLGPAVGLTLSLARVASVSAEVVVAGGIGSSGGAAFLFRGCLVGPGAGFWAVGAASTSELVGC
ncbi:hypothetical protein HOY80DRAFT_987030 [Tuber brumale]|nr:hypothetical protein HOY80DRAFT_987030 [Tuber brumale]